MTLSQIQNFILVAEDLSYSVVAEKTYLSRQAIARSIHELEKELDVVLFETDHTNHLVLTEAGEKLLPEFRAVIHQTEKIRKKAAAFSKKLAPLHVAFSDSIAVFVFQDIIGMLYQTMKDSPKIISKITQESNLELSKGNHPDADIILMLGKPFAPEGYTVEVLKSYPAVLSIPYSSPLYREGAVMPEDLKNQTLIYPIAQNEELEAFAGEHQIRLLPMSNFYACSYTSIQNAYLILDAPFPSTDQTLIQKPITGFSFSWDLLLLYKSDSANPNISTVRSQLQKVARQEKAPWIFKGPSL